MFWYNVITFRVGGCAGMFGAGVFLIGLSYLDCTQTALAVVLLVLAVSMSGFVYSGYFVNHMDIAPQYAGTLMGISNGIAAISGFIAPYVASRVTESVSRAPERFICRLVLFWPIVLPVVPKSTRLCRSSVMHVLWLNSTFYQKTV